MKKILFKKLLIDYMSFFLIALLASTIIIWVFQAVNFLDIMIEDGRDYLVYISYSLLNYPKIFSKLFPFVLFFSLFYVTIKYELNNELMILWNFGINKIQIVNFILKISFLLMLIQILLTSVIVPKAQDKARSFLRASKVNFFESFIKPQRFIDTIANVTIYSEKKDEEGNLYNLYIKKEISENNLQITYAKKGVFKELNDFPILVLYEGETITEKNNKYTNFSFSKSDFPLKNLVTNTTTYKKTQEISTSELFNCINLLYNLMPKFKKNNLDNDNCNTRNIKNIIKEFYKRLIIPLYIPTLTLIPLILIINSKESTNYFKTRTFTFIIGLVFIIFSETTIRFISENFTQNINLSIIPLISITTLYLIFLYKFKLTLKGLI
jgi:lipopolysaccharide export system permease protein